MAKKSVGCKEEILHITKNTQSDESKRVKPQQLESDFLKIFNQLIGRYNRWTVWSDFITIFACSISNILDKRHYEERENLYKSIVKKYNTEELKLFPQLMAQTFLALGIEPEQDFLGKIYMNLNLGNATRGQFFTPYSVCRLMAELSIDNELIKETIKKQGYISVNDPTCGAGATLIAAYNKLKRAFPNMQESIILSGQDIDQTVALMCYIQLSALGVSGFVKVGNTFSDPIIENDLLTNYWFTPNYYLDMELSKR
ncbi:MAG: SAM-dependent DNA methyltransferase [Clostridiales bacterium]|nr:SAM-dependent DNA methyltransferase [Clostridiales bacterium]